MKRILIAAGGTGGHIFPGLAIAQALEEQKVEIFWIGDQGSLVRQLVPSQYHPYFIPITGLRRKKILTWLKAPFLIMRAIYQSYRYIRQIKPDLVLTLGGYVSGPVGIAAKFARVPLVIHEQNSIAGLTNRCLARIATQLLQAFPEAFPKKLLAKTVGNPVRSVIASISAPEARFNSRISPLRLLVFGGSQGSHFINEAVIQAVVRMLPSDRPSLWHQVGKQNEPEVKEKYRQQGIEAKVAAFIENMPEAYEWADLIVARAGALTVAEIAAAGVGSILIPFSYAVDNHQYYNACFLEKAGAAVVITELDFDSVRFKELLEQLAHSREKLLLMAQAARKVAKPQATTEMIELLKLTALKS